MPKLKSPSFKQRKFRRELIKTLSPTEAAMRAYNCKSRKVAGVIASQNLAKLNISLADLMSQMGLTDEQDVMDLIRLRKAVKQISCNIFIKKDGKMKGADGKTFDFIEVDDNMVQLKALELTCKLKGRLKDKQEVEHKEVGVSLTWIVQVVNGNHNDKQTRTKTGSRISKEMF